MIKALFVLASVCALGACSTNTKGSWSCNTVGGSTCASIAQIDSSEQGTASPQPAARSSGAYPVRWWDTQPFVFSDGSGPAREADQVMRIVFAPWVDAQGDYHARSEVFAVVRRGGWQVPSSSAPPSEVR